jgi:hypothetical protein
MSIPRPSRFPAALGAALLAFAGCTTPPHLAASASTAATTPIPPGQARLLFYRDYQPSVSFNMANIDVDGVRAASVPAFGPGVYRDVAPGQHHIVPVNYIAAAPGDAVVTVEPGQTVYLQIEDDPIVLGDLTVYQKDVFSVRAVPASLALAQIAVSPR